MKLALTGDVMLGRLVNEYAFHVAGREPGYVWGESLEMLATADLRLINLECVIASRGEPWRPEEKEFHFRASPAAIAALAAAHIDAVSLANNHVLDFGADALLKCLDRLDAAKIARAGAGRRFDEACQPAFMQSGDQTVALLSLTDNEPEWAASDFNPGVFFVDYDEHGLLEPYREQVQNAICEARRRSDVLIVAAHIGPNWGAPSVAMRALARQLIAFGADCYWGHSNHTPQGIEVFRGKPILYSTGDFIDDYAVDPYERNDLSFLFVLEWLGPERWKLKLVPTSIEHFQSWRPSPNDAEFVMERMQRQSAEFGTQVRRNGGGLIVGC